MRSVTDAPRRLRGKETLPARKRPVYRETPDVVAGACRFIQAIGRRIACEDPDDLAYLVTLDQELRQAWAAAVAGIRQSGFTDREIGQVLGTSRQAVEQRWPRYRSEAESGGMGEESA